MVRTATTAPIAGALLGGSFGTFYTVGMMGVQQMRPYFFGVIMTILGMFLGMALWLD